MRSGGISQTSLSFTGQRKDGTGLYYYHARYYDPGLGTFVSPDSIVPGVAAGSGGGAATLGVDSKAALGPLTADFHEPGFAKALAEAGGLVAQPPHEGDRLVAGIVLGQP